MTTRNELHVKTYISTEKPDDQSKGIASDQDLLAKILKGDKNSFGILYQRYLDQVYNFIFFQISRNQQEAEDLTEEVFLRAFQIVMQTTEKNKNFRALVFMIARNLVIDRYRAQKDEVDIENVTIVSEKIGNPQEALENSQISKNLTDAIKFLSPNFQEVIILRYILDMTTNEIAEIMDLSHNHVRVLQYRALQHLKGYMKKSDIIKI